MTDVRKKDEFHDGHEDGFEPVEAVDLSKCQSVDDVLEAMSKSSFGGRNIGEAVDVLEEMVNDKKCFKVLTISGAMTVAKMQLIFTEMIDRGWVDAVVATGALIAHGFIEGTGMTHFKYRGGMDDKKLYELGYDRVYDTLELEKNFSDAAALVDEIFGRGEHDGKSYTSPEICEIIGKHLVENNIGGRSILKSAYEKKIPVYIPALSDSELGMDIIALRYSDRREDRVPVKITHDAFEDVIHFAKISDKQERMGIFTIGGGVPRNWAQQIGPFLRLKYPSERRNAEIAPYYYGVRICPEPVHWGGLSGCTYSEGMSWGKFVPDGKYSEVYADATIALPFVVKGLMERFDAKK